MQVDLFDGYWEDIGTIRSFYEANLALAAADRPFDLASAAAPIYTRARFLAPSRLDGATVTQQPGGRRLPDRKRRGDRKQRDRPALPHRPQRDDSQLGADGLRRFTRRRKKWRPPRPPALPPIGIAEGSYIDGAIIDKNCRIGRNVRVCNDRKVNTSEETPEAMIADGIVVVQKGATLKDGWHL